MLKSMSWRSRSDRRGQVHFLFPVEEKSEPSSTQLNGRLEYLAVLKLLEVACWHFVNHYRHIKTKDPPYKQRVCVTFQAVAHYFW